MNLALLSSQEDMLDAAKSEPKIKMLMITFDFPYLLRRYYEENSETIDKAILLFHKVCASLELCALLK